MVLSDLFKREESFCTLCLRQPGAALLKRCTLEQMQAYTSMLEVAASSPYLCGWCAAPLHCITRLRQRAQRAQTWLRAYYTSDELPQNQQRQLLAELEHLHRSNLKCAIGSPTTVAESTTSLTLADDVTLVDLTGEFHVIGTQLDSAAQKGTINNENFMKTLRTELEFKIDIDPLQTGTLTTVASTTTNDQSNSTAGNQTIVTDATELTTQSIVLHTKNSANKTPNHIAVRPYLTPRGRPIAPVLVISGIRPTPKPQRIQKDRLVNQIMYKRTPQKRRLPPEKPERSYPQGWDSELCTLAPRLEKELAQRVCALDEITAENVKMLAYDFAELKRVKHDFDATLGLAGDAWLEAFLKRHSLRLSKGPSGMTWAKPASSCNYESEDDEFEDTWKADEIDKIITDITD